MKKVLLQLCFILLSTSVFSQINVNIKIIDAENNSTLPGATVIIKGSNDGGSTNLDGILTLKVNPNDVLEVKMIGYEMQTISVDNRTEISVVLKTSAKQLADIVIVGTRTAGRVKTESPVPVDVINVNQVGLPTGRMDLTSLMNVAAPSLNHNKQSGSDGADHIDLATLRGLGPDQTLVLINGKRRHQTAFISVFGTRGRGNSGTDLNSIPISAIDRVEILRDGASAQYGSDAIAGVINIVLKKDTGVFSGDIGYGGYYDKKFNPAFDKSFNQYQSENKFDGAALSFNGNYGIPLGKHDGFLNISGNFVHQGKTYRQVLDTTNFLTNDNALPINYYRRANGDGSVASGGVFLNSEIPIGTSKTQFYAFGGYNYSSSDAFAFTRDFSARPQRFPTDANGNLNFTSDILQTTSDGTIYYDPHIQTQVTDFSAAVGLKGKMASGWEWDASNNTGKNDFHFYGDRTFNASLGSGQTHFDDGGFSFLQNTTNINFNKALKNIAQGFNLAAGAEFRYENYQLYAGEEASYKNYDPTKSFPNANGDTVTVAGGAQGFPGYQPSDEANANRTTFGFYVDGELDITKKFLITAAVRAENYSDFGFTSNYKFSTRYKVASNFVLRGSVSTGFRAPSLQQINFSSTFTTVQGGTIAEVKIAPNYSPITKAAGIPDLKQEKSVNGGVGFTYSPINNFNITVDGYIVQVKDRVVLSGQFDASDPTLDPTLAAQLNALSASLAQFFANAVNTTNKGVDLVIEYKKVTTDHFFRSSLAANIQKMTIDKINVPTKLNDTPEHRQTFLSDREQKFILASAPESKFALGLEYGIHKLSFGTRFTYYGKTTILGYGEDGLGINPTVPTDDGLSSVADQYIYSGKVVSDLFATYKLCNEATFCIGVDNIFGVHPDLAVVKNAKYWAYNNEPAGPWDAVQMGGNGMMIYAKLGFKF